MNDFKNRLKEHLHIHVSDQHQLDQDMEYHVLEETDVEKSIREFQEIITKTYKKSFKFRMQTKKVINNKSVPWWTNELTILRKRTNAQKRR